MGAALREHQYSEAAITLRLRASRAALFAIGSMACATLALIAFTPGPAAARILAATWIACAALHAAHGAALHRGRHGVRELTLGRGGEIEVRGDADAWRVGTLRDGSFVTPWLTLVRWREHGARFDRTVAILPGMLGAEEYRRLRVLLRWS